MGKYYGRNGREVIMAKYYGTLQGNRGQASRLGSTASGISASVQSWAGSLTVSLDGDPDAPTVTIARAEGSGRGGKTIFVGSLADLDARLTGAKVWDKDLNGGFGGYREA